MLMDHTNAVGKCICGTLDDHRLAPHKDLTAVRGIKAVEDVHQGGLSRSILT